MATIVPWVKPTDVLESIRTGAHIGLQLAQQQQAAAEAEANRQERAQRASEALQMHGLETALRLMEMRARNAELAGYHKESIDARKAADVLREKIIDARKAADVLREKISDKQIALREKEMAGRDLHNAAMEAIAQQRADRRITPEIINVGGKNFAVNPSTGHFQLLDKPAASELPRLQAAIAATLRELHPPGGAESALSEGEKMAAIENLKAMRARQAEIMNLPAKEPMTPIVTGSEAENNFLGIHWPGYKPAVPFKTNWVPESVAAALTNAPASRIPGPQGSIPSPEGASAVLTNAAPRLNLPMPKLAPTGVRVRQKSTGRLGTWTDEGPPPSDFEIIEEGKIDEGPDDAEFIDEEVEQE